VHRGVRAAPGSVSRGPGSCRWMKAGPCAHDRFDNELTAVISTCTPGSERNPGHPPGSTPASPRRATSRRRTGSTASCGCSGSQGPSPPRRSAPWAPPTSQTPVGQDFTIDEPDQKRCGASHHRQAAGGAAHEDQDRAGPRAPRHRHRTPSQADRRLRHRQAPPGPGPSGPQTRPRPAAGAPRPRHPVATAAASLSPPAGPGRPLRRRAHRLPRRPYCRSVRGESDSLTGTRPPRNQSSRPRRKNSSIPAPGPPQKTPLTPPPTRQKPPHHPQKTPDAQLLDTREHRWLKKPKNQRPKARLH
jgi:hypothetical protein